jgi:hypothetical protein
MTKPTQQGGQGPGEMPPRETGAPPKLGLCTVKVAGAEVGKLEHVTQEECDRVTNQMGGDGPIDWVADTPA